MPLNAKVSPLIENRKRGLAISDLIEQTRAKTPVIAQAFEHVQNTVNDLYQQMSKPAQVTEFTVTDPITGKQIAWIGGIAKGGVSYSGAAFSHLWVGPNADPATAPFFCDGSNVVIGKNGVVYVQDMAGNTGATFGVTQEAAKVITGATNAAPVVVTLAAHGYVNGDTVLIAGAVGNTAINGYRIVQGVTANTFTLTDPAGVAINGNGALSGAPTATRYYAGVLAQVFAVGPSFAGYKLRAFADGSLRISNATIDLSSANGRITLDPTAPALNIYDATAANVAWLGVNGANTGIYAKNAWFGGTSPADAVIVVTADGVTITNNQMIFTGGGIGSTIITIDNSVGFTVQASHSSLSLTGGIVELHDTLTSLTGLMSAGSASFSNISGSRSAFIGVGLDGYVSINGNQVVGPRLAAVTAPTGGTTIDAQARTAINTIISRLSAAGHGLTA